MWQQEKPTPCLQPPTHKRHILLAIKMADAVGIIDGRHDNPTITVEQIATNYQGGTVFDECIIIDPTVDKDND